MAILGGALSADRALAGELTVSWPAAGSDAETGYRVYVGDASGVYGRVIDAGHARQATLTTLEDEKLHYVAVKAYDGKGNESPSFSPELACFAAPRIEAVAPASILPGEAVFVTLKGANLDAGAHVSLRDGRLHARSSVRAGSSGIILLLEADGPVSPGKTDAPAAIVLDPAVFTVVNPCRKSEEFFAEHPEIIDLDGSGRVDTQDLEAIRAAFGARRGEESFSPGADLDGDGAIDGRDLARVLSRLGTDAVPATIPPATDR